MTLHASHQAVSIHVNLYESPKSRAEITAWVAAQPQQSTVKTYMTVGDLHASTLRLVTHWVHGGIATVNETNYCDLKRVLDNYADGTKPSQAIKKDFDTVVGALTIQEKNTIGFRSIGDNLADRDMNDYFILKLYALIKNKKILYSNHDAFFMFHSQVLSRSTQEISEWMQEFKAEHPHLVNQHRSFLQLAQWVVDGIVKPEELQPLIENYRSAVLLLDYDVDLASNHISLYSHAPIDFEVIESLAKHFGIEYRDDKITDLCKTIDAINAAFQKALQHPETARAIYRESAELRSEKSEKLNDKYLYPDYPFFNITWSRPKEVVCGSRKVAHTKPYRDKLYLPENKQYGFTFIHGHVGPSPENSIQHKNRGCFETALDKHYLNVDTNVGKWSYSEAAKRLVFSSNGETTYYLATNDYAPELSAAINPDTQPHLLAPTSGRDDDDEKAKQGCCLSNCCAALFPRPKTREPVSALRTYSTAPSC